jgi:hypothetical protein
MSHHDSPQPEQPHADTAVAVGRAYLDKGKETRPSLIMAEMDRALLPYGAGGAATVVERTSREDVHANQSRCREKLRRQGVLR